MEEGAAGGRTCACVAAAGPVDDAAVSVLTASAAVQVSPLVPWTTRSSPSSPRPLLPERKRERGGETQIRGRC
jgi:hypothetical protein